MAEEGEKVRIGRAGERSLKVRQHDTYDCGAACLSAIAAWYGIRVSLAKIRESCGCTSEGISIKGILDGATDLGLSGKAYRSKYKELPELRNINMPFIAHVTEENGLLHFIVIVKVGENHVKIMDPATGSITKEKSDIFLKRWSGIIILLVPGENFCERDEKIKLPKVVWRLVKYHICEYRLILAGSVVLVLAGIVNSFFIQQIIDRAVGGGDMELLLFIGASLASVTAISLFIQYARNIFLMRNGIKIESRLITGYIRKLFRLHLPFFSEYQAGDLNSRITDAVKVRAIVSEGIISLIVSVITLAGSITAMFLYHSGTALFITLFIPLYIILFYLSKEINRKYSRKAAVAGAKFDSKILNQLKAVESIKYNNAEAIALNSLEKEYTDLADTIYKGGSVSLGFEALSDTLSRTISVSVLIVGGAFSISGAISAGEIVSFYTLCGFFTVPLNNIISMNYQIAESHVALERLFEILQIEDEESIEGSEIDETTVPCFTDGGRGNGAESGYCAAYKKRRISKSVDDLLKIRNGDIVLHNVSFSYRGREELFSNIGIIFRKGNITLLTGGSGTGKSTLTALVSGNLIPQEGRITIGDMDIRDVSKYELRELITVLQQQPALMDCSLYDNISCGKAGSTEDILKLCRRTNIEKLVKSLPMGLHTNIVETGSKVSGGESQMIALARALYRDTEIYIFDEPTAWLDNENKKIMIDEIAGLKQKGKTVIVISHKPEEFIDSDLCVIADEIKDLGEIKGKK